MPIKKHKHIEERKKKKIAFNLRYFFYIAGIIIFVFLLYLFLKSDINEAKKGFLNRAIAKKQTEQKRSETASIPPVEKARLELVSIDNRDIVRVVIEKNEPDIEYRFQWRINGKIIEDYNSDSVSNFKEGDVIGVLITPVFKDREGQPRFLSLTIHSTVPKVLGISEPKIDNNIMVFKILTEDTSKEELMFSLVDAPKGMIIDSKTGEIRWNIKDVPSGRYEGKALIKNKKNAEVIYPFSINLS